MGYGVPMSSSDWDMDNIHVGDLIRERRLVLGLSQEELAKRMGYTSRAAVSNIENSKEDITVTRLMKIARALNTTPSKLLGEDRKESRLDIISSRLTEEGLKDLTDYAEYLLWKQSGGIS